MKAYKILAQVLLFMLVFSFIYSVIGIVFSKTDKTFFYNRPLIEYIKISLQCILGSTVLFLPSALENKFKISFSSGMHILYILFLYMAVILGEVWGYYRKFYHWDTVLHTLSGAMLSAFGFCIIDIINKSKRVNLVLSNLFISFFSFCFAVMLDTLWEIIEFIMDALMNLNMQQYILPDGTVLSGHYAIFDTMKDLIVDAIGALFVSIIGYILLKMREKNVRRGHFHNSVV
ncbi:MAG: hypothetical protein LBC27_06815 [Spirochaetaceae bacterium]|jgi:hypothetical protein|nr:hypothetical protein [Spirochaetaceae bacterium]